MGLLMKKCQQVIQDKPSLSDKKYNFSFISNFDISYYLKKHKVKRLETLFNSNVNFRQKKLFKKDLVRVTFSIFVRLFILSY